MVIEWKGVSERMVVEDGEGGHVGNRKVVGDMEVLRGNFRNWKDMSSCVDLQCVSCFPLNLF